MSRSVTWTRRRADSLRCRGIRPADVRGAVAGVLGFRPESRQASTNRRNSKRTGLFSEFNTSQITLVEISTAVLSAAGKKKAESL